MIDETVYKIALAGLLHDIGKFAERAKGERGSDDAGFFPSDEFINNNQALYQPFYEGRFTHSHAVYTAAFIDHFEKFLPRQFNRGEWGLGDSFVNLAAGHHRPESPLQWIIAIADRVSSGFDRTEFEEKYNKEVDVRDYKKTRLLTLFEGLRIDGNYKSDSLKDYEWRYPLRELSPENIFPLNTPEIREIDGKIASREYRDLFFNFVSDLEKLSHKNNIPLWFEHLDSLFMIYASHIPAATVGYVVPDVSLYDHSRMTSALASALYRYHDETDSLNIDAIKEDHETEKFLLVSGDFYGIQDFIFTEGSGTGRASAKLLRGRSFYISLLSELAADMLCRKLELPPSSIILNAAGKFTVLAQNTAKAKGIVSGVEKDINNWLIKHFYGQASIGFATVEASCEDFVSGNFADLWDRLSKSVDRRKYSRFDISKCGCVETYLDSFDNELGICSFCNKRPAHRDARIKDDHSCRICRDHAFIGENLVKNDQIAITTTEAHLFREKLLEPIFGRYQLSFAPGELGELSRHGELLKFWNIGIDEKGNVAKNITAKFLNGYVPKYEDDDLYDDRYFAGRKSEKKKLEMIDHIKTEKEAKTPKTFAHLAVKALNFTGKKDRFTGIEALGILKADVDNLGLLFACGFRRERLTLSRLATLSRQMNNYFSIFLPYKLKTVEGFKNIYTVFAGGDDLFLIGPWNRIIHFAEFLYDSFRKYVCYNSHITISAGIALHKPSVPVLAFAETSEKALHMSKSKGRDSISVFRVTAKWNDFVELQEIKKTLNDWLNKEQINNAMLFRINELIEMKRQEDEITRAGVIHIEEMECLKWRARLKYTIARNVGKKLKGEDRHEAIEDVMQIAKWLEDHGGTLRIPLWQVIYERR